jgi:hypothetical protein
MKSRNLRPQKVLKHWPLNVLCTGEAKVGFYLNVKMDHISTFVHTVTYYELKKLEMTNISEYRLRNFIACQQARLKNNGINLLTKLDRFVSVNIFGCSKGSSLLVRVNIC